MHHRVLTADLYLDIEVTGGALGRRRRRAVTEPRGDQSAQLWAGPNYRLPSGPAPRLTRGAPRAGTRAARGLDRGDVEQNHVRVSEIREPDRLRRRQAAFCRPRSTRTLSISRPPLSDGCVGSP
ncbi:hypothetical protein RHA1_ro07080 [Rhodococcus jostii RHA1]|uniref:Uncharacterized protein n=1 Tax=Rhodococcus jostii (strain RHA1) TaxID=101510 RepID=Q0S0U2_RHOJR|nr:hypothetical protein RHA1_ro07080 [Rhodococcus jostii RHA1]